MTRRIVHVLHHSPSLLHDEPLNALLTRTAWHLEVARQQQRYIHGVDVECWTPERRMSRVVRGEQHGIKYLFFPAYALGYQRELSPSLFEHLEYNVGRISAALCMSQACSSRAPSWRQASTRKAPEPQAGSHTFNDSTASGDASTPMRSKAGSNAWRTIGSVSERGV